MIIIIPARLGSTRLPRKFMLDDTGKPLICHTIDRALESTKARKIFVISEDQEILDVVNNYSTAVDTCLTPQCDSGTERIKWFIKNSATIFHEIIVNLQGDEPELSGKYLDELVTILFDDQLVDVATIAAHATPSQYVSRDVVKAVLDHNKNAMYFSRASIPYDSDTALKHIGVYAYRNTFLLANMEPTTLGCESLEQLQWLQSGFRIRVLVKDIKEAGIDTKQEYLSFVKRWEANQNQTITPSKIS